MNKKSDPLNNKLKYINYLSAKSDNRPVCISILMSDFMNRFDVPVHLRGVITACKGITLMLNALENIGGNTDAGRIKGWRTCIDILNSSQEYLQGIKVQLLWDNESGEKSLSGELGIHPLYGIFRTGINTYDYIEQFSYLVAHMFIAWQELSSNELYKGDLPIVCRAIRNMGIAKNEITLSQLPTETFLHSTYTEELTLIFNDNATNYDSKYRLKTIIKCFEYASRVRKKPIHNNSNGNKNGQGGSKICGELPSRLHVIETASINLEDDEYKAARIFKLSNVDIWSEPGRKHDLTTDDYPEKLELIILVPRNLSYIYLDPKKLILQLHGKRDALKRIRQILPTDLSEFSPYEWAVVIEYITDIIENHNDKIELGILLLISLMYGQSISGACNLRILRKEPTKTLPNKCDIAYCIDSQCILIRSYFPDLKGRMTDIQKSQAIPVEDYISFGCPDIMIGGIEYLIENRKHNRRSGYNIFDKDNGLYISGAKTVCKDIQDENDIDVTLSIVEGSIFNIIARESNDIVDAMLITAHNDARAASQIHYTTRKISLLQKIHRDAVNNVLMKVDDELDASGHILNRWLPHMKHSKDGHVGSPFTPKKSTVQNLVKFLLSELNNPLTVLNFGLVYYHNIYTIYTMWSLDISTGSRCVWNKYHYTDEMDFDEGICLSDDKGRNRNDFTNSRNVPFVKFCQIQMKHYLKHRKIIVQRLLRVNPDQYFRAKNDSNQDLASKYRVGIQNQKQSSVGQLFLLTDEFEITPLIPNIIKNLISGVYDLKLNTNRHYLRSHLRNMKVDGEIIDPIFSHFRAGQESHGRFSSDIESTNFSYVEDIISDLIISDGFVHHKGVCNV